MRKAEDRLTILSFKYQVWDTGGLNIEPGGYQQIRAGGLVILEHLSVFVGAHPLVPVWALLLRGDASREAPDPRA